MSRTPLDAYRSETAAAGRWLDDHRRDCTECGGGAPCEQAKLMYRYWCRNAVIAAQLEYEQATPGQVTPPGT